MSGLLENHCAPCKPGRVGQRLSPMIPVLQLNSKTRCNHVVEELDARLYWYWTLHTPKFIRFQRDKRQSGNEKTKIHDRALIREGVGDSSSRGSRYPHRELAIFLRFGEENLSERGITERRA